MRKSSYNFIPIIFTGVFVMVGRCALCLDIIFRFLSLFHKIELSQFSCIITIKVNR